MNSRALKRWEIPSKERLRELKAFAWQYNSWLSALDEISEIPALVNDGMPHGTNIGDPVAHIAEKREVIKLKVDMVDWAVANCSSDATLQSAVRKAVTTPYGLTYPYLKAHGYVLHERDAYYEAMHKFYWLLDSLKF